MNASDVIKAWKNPKFRASLDGTQSVAALDNPAGMQDLDVAMLDRIGGATIHSNEGGVICLQESVHCSASGQCVYTGQYCLTVGLCHY